MEEVGLFILELQPVREWSRGSSWCQKLPGRSLKKRSRNMLRLQGIINMRWSYPQKEADIQLCGGIRYRWISVGRLFSVQGNQMWRRGDLESTALGVAGVD
ncbi:hypothetical protein TNCV_2480581 [Trichonephila clavipes]|nr:hypothetical protein TNCV_2480581 [Trichonephila clavipes]